MVTEIMEREKPQIGGGDYFTIIGNKNRVSTLKMVGLLSSWEYLLNNSNNEFSDCQV